VPARPDGAPPLTAADRLLCACAHSVNDAAAARQLRQLPLESIEWEAMPRRFVIHGLTILAASHLATVRHAVPPATWNQIHAQALAARASALALVAELTRILHALEADSVDALPFKGPLLGLDAYGDLAARPFVDLDILVSPEDLDRAMATLTRLGYEAQYRFSPARDAWFRRVDGDYPMVHTGTSTLVELHGRAVSRRFGWGLPTADLWRRRAAQPLGDTVLPVLCDDDRFYLYVVHGAKHRWERLEWLASTTALLQRRGGDVSALLRPPYRHRRAVLLACHLAHELLGAPLSDATASAIGEDPAIVSFSAEVRRHIFSDRRDDGHDDTAGKLWFNWRLAGGWGQRIGYLYRWCTWPSPEDWNAMSIPDPFFFLYRLTRPARLLWQYARLPAASGSDRHG
jgi:hypothetical protein